MALSITDDQGAGEGVPSQGGSTTTATNGQVLSRILSTISREQCRYVGVIASDTRDKLFLIRLIREHCPDVRVFVTDGDLLLTHPEYRYYMRGVIIGSTYPLVPRNQNWVKSATTERILFPSVGAQGYYNATLMHFGVHDQLLEYGAPAFALRDADRPDEADQRPPIWISMVAPNGAIVPLHLYTRYEDKYGYVASSEEAEADRRERRVRRARLPRGDAPGRARPVRVVGLPDRAGLGQSARPAVLAGRIAAHAAGPVLPQHHPRLAGAAGGPDRCAPSGRMRRRTSSRRRGRSRSSSSAIFCLAALALAMVKPLVSPWGRDRAPRPAACRRFRRAAQQLRRTAGWRPRPGSRSTSAAVPDRLRLRGAVPDPVLDARRLRPADAVLRPGRGPEHRAVAADAALLRLPRLRGVGVLPAQADAHRRAIPRADAVPGRRVVPPPARGRRATCATRCATRRSLSGTPSRIAAAIIALGGVRRRRLDAVVADGRRLGVGPVVLRRASPGCSSCRRRRWSGCSSCGAG